MDRRRYLETTAGLVTAGLAGCLSLASPSTDDPDPPDDAARRISVADVGTTPAEVAAEFDVAVGDPWIAPDGTAAVEATVRNGGLETERFSLPIYKAPSSRYGKPGIVLYNTGAGDAPPEDYAPTCLYGESDGGERNWEPGTTLDGEDLTYTREGPPHPELAFGESHTETLLVADDPTVEGCLSAGEYRFGRMVRLEELPDGTRIAFDEVEEREDVTLWTFTLLVEDLTEE